MTFFGSIEAGGTKFVCMVAASPNRIVAESRFPTTTPQETLARTIDFFKKNPPVQSIGIAAFGPLDLDPVSDQFGFITSTPKPGWQFTDIRGEIQKALTVPVAIDTDVNAAALSELKWGAGIGLSTLVYFTIGTGIGGGCVVNGVPLHGLVHPEMGHMRIPHDRAADPFEGCCPYHKDCLEGLASGTALNARWNTRAETLPPEHPAWQLEVEYLSQAVHNVICTLSPQRVILGGGVMQQQHLFPAIRARVQVLLNQYVQSPKILTGMNTFITPPALGNQAGVLGGLALAMTC